MSHTMNFCNIWNVIYIAAICLDLCESRFFCNRQANWNIYKSSCPKPRQVWLMALANGYDSANPWRKTLSKCKC